MVVEDTFPKLLKRNHERWGDKKVALRYKKFGVWGQFTWKDYYEKAKCFGLGLKSFGLVKGDKVSIIGENTPEECFAELGIQGVGGIVVSLHFDTNAPELRYFLKQSDTKFAIVDGKGLVDRLIQIKDELPLLEKIIYWHPKGIAHYPEPFLSNFRHVIDSGKTYGQNYPDFFEKSVKEGKGEDLALILYTSGVKDLPKAAMLTYANILSGTKEVIQLNDWAEDERIFIYNSLAWIVEQVFSIAGPLLSGCSVSFPESLETASLDIKEVEPTYLCFIPMQWERLISIMQGRISESTSLKRFVFNSLLPVGYKYTDLVNQSRKPGMLLKLFHMVADLVLFRSIRKDMGLNRLRFAWTSGASLNPDSFRLLQAIGIPLKAHYASTEVCAICNSGKEFKMETVGRPVPGTDVKISEEGEILVRGDQVFKGYYKDPEATSKAIKDGWFHTGDAGFLDDSGHLIFLDRLADLTELAGGAKVAPQYIESRIRFSSYIKNAITLPEKSEDYISVIITIDLENVRRWAAKNGILYTSYAELSQKREVYSLIYKEIIRVNRTLPIPSKIKKFVILNKDFEADEGELTRAGKLRRYYIKEHYKDLIKGIYSGENEILGNTEIKQVDGRMEKIKTIFNVMDIIRED